MAIQKSMDVAYIAAPLAVPGAMLTTLITSPEVAAPLPVSRIKVSCSFMYQSGAGTTAVHVEVNRGTDEIGLLVYSFDFIQAAPPGPTFAPVAFSFLDQQENVDFVQYTLSIYANSASAPGSAEATMISVETF
ncbi:MAG: hypothetical protein ACRD1I_08100 [Terriglobia bacterium]